MSSAVAPKRAVSATVLLMLVLTGGCLAMASAVPVANGRRLQQFAAISGSQLQALTSGLEELKDQLQVLLQSVPPQDDLLGQLQKVAANFAEAQGQLQSAANGLQSLQLLGQTQAATVLESLLSQIAAKLDSLSKKFQNPSVGGCFRDHQTSLVDAITEFTSSLKLTTAGLPMQPTAVIAALEDLGNSVRQVNPCAPGLEKLWSNREGTLAAIGELVANIQ
jgi:DNA repair exonuclease SbcCD ATPase subunit